MTDPDFILLYVDNPSSSAAFYSELLGKKPIESSPTFAMFALDNGVNLGLWSRHTVEPTATTLGGGGEIGFTVKDDATVDSIHALWKKRGLCFAQAPTRMDFGYTFLALDPDGHRLRVYCCSSS